MTQSRRTLRYGLVAGAVILFGLATVPASALPGQPVITDARLLSDQGLQDRVDAGDVIGLTFDEDMAGTSDDAGQTFELSDADGDVFRLVCGAAVTCILQINTRDIVLTLNNTPTDINPAGNGLLTYPATITSVSAGVSDTGGAPVDLAASPDRVVDNEAPAAAGRPIITDARVVADGGLQDRFDQNDVISLTFSEPMTTAIDDTGEGLELTDGDGDVFRLTCAVNASCVLSGDARTLTITVSAPVTDLNAAGDGIISMPATITTVSARYDDTGGAQLDLAGSTDKVVDKEDAPPAGGPFITDARVVADAGLQGRIDAGDVIRLTFNEDMAGTSDDIGQTFELTDGDGDVFRLTCGASVTCNLGTPRELTLTLNNTPTDLNPAGNGLLTYPATITSVSAGLDDTSGTQLDLPASTDRVVDNEDPPAAGRPIITDARVVTDAGLQDRFDQNDVIRLTFNENMAATADDVGQTFELTDTDGDRFTLICGAAVNCVLGGDLRTLTLTLNTTPTDANAGGNGVLNIPATITAVSGGLDDATGTQLDLAASTDRLVDKAAKACTITGAGMITGTAGDDVICGSPGADRIAGLGGNDTIYALDGDDQVTGGDGNDQVFGGLGSDQLLGGNGDDTLSGDGGGVDRLAGEAGDDNLVVVDGTSNDAAAGGAHVTGDTCTVDPGDAVAQCEQVTTA